jgi:hypothetical protein
MSSMALRRIRYEEGEGSDEGSYRIDNGLDVGFADDGALVMPLEVVADVSVAHFVRAVSRSEEYYGQHIEGIYISDDSKAGFDPNTAHRACLLDHEQGHLAVQAGFLVETGKVPRAPDVGSLVAPLLARHRGAWGGMWTDAEAGWVSVGVSAALSGSARSLGELYALGEELQMLLTAAGGAGGLSAPTAADLVRAARVDVLLGQPESAWLDAKREPYTLATDAARWEVAKDVVAFANTGAAALILLGVETKKTPNGDVLASPRPFEIAGIDVVALRAVLRERITPAIPDLDVGVVEARAGTGYGYGWIFIPSQPAELEPFIVAGALLGTNWRGAHMSIPIRTGEDTVYLDPAAVHSMLAAGRLALRNAPRQEQEQ